MEKIIANSTDDKAGEILRQYEQLYGSRGVWEGHWQEIAERIIPSSSHTFQGNFRTPGDKKNQNVFDSTAAIALNRFAAILDSLLTPRNARWHRLATDNPLLEKNRSAQLWFEQANTLLFKYRYSETSNFASQNQQNYVSLGAFGTGGMFIDQLFGDRGLRYRNIHLGEMYIAENHQGMVDKAFRRFKMTARQALQKWPETCPAMIKEASKANPEREYEFLHHVCPRTDLDTSRKDYKGMKYASYYICKDTKSMLEEGGFRTFPYAISRYEQALGEIYGRSPAMDVLPAVKTLNEEKKTMLKAGHHAVDPVLIAHDDGVLDGFNRKPGAINYGGVSADGRPLVHALPTGNVNISKELMDDERKIINDAFLVTVFQILTDPRAMTATEVMERTREKGILLAPTVGRQQSEYLGPMIERELDLLAQQGLLPPMPRVLQEAQGDYKIEYDSPLSRAQRAEEASGVMRSIETALQVIQITQNPEPLDFFDWDQIMPEVAHINGVPLRWIKSMDDVMKVRQGRAQQQQAQQMIQAAPAAASVVKAVGTKGVA